MNIKLKPNWLRLPDWQGLQNNPVFVRETRSLTRGARSAIIISLYLLVSGGIVGMIYLSLTIDLSPSNVVEISQSLGKAIFFTVATLNLALISFVAPGLTAGALASERERQTYDLVRVTLLTPSRLVEGKMASASVFALVLLSVSFPLQAAAYWLGGITLAEVLIGWLMPVVWALALTALGLFISTFVRSSLAASILSYLGSALLTIGPFVLLGFAAFFLGMTSSLANLNSFQQRMMEVILFTLGYLLVLLNPLLTGLFSEVMFMEEQTLFFTSVPVGSNSYPVLSPWILFSVVYLALTVLLLRLAAWRLARESR